MAAISAMVVAATIAAYHYSFLTLVAAISLQTPLAYLALVPLIALVLAAVKALSSQPGPNIEDRFVDYVIGLPLVTTALAMLIILPVHASEYFWLWRLDLLSLPLFVAGAISLLLGVRTLWRLRFPVLYLFAAWPLPYIRFMTDWMGVYSDTTLAALRLVLRAAPVAVPVVGSDGSLFSITQAGLTFVLSVASACSGVNGLAAFLVVGTAFASVIQGRLSNKVLWLGAGLVIEWILNLGRILSIFAAGRIWGETAAVDGLHPFIGLVTFGAGIVLMIALLPCFRLGLPTRSVPSRAREGGPGRGQVLPKLAIGVLLLTTVVATVANANLEQFSSTFSALGPPRLAGLTETSGQLDGWSLQQIATYPWSRPYFGQDSSWIRYQYSAQPDGSIGAALPSGGPVILDVISTSDSAAFSVYGLEACYNFHNYRMVDVRTVDLGSGVIAKSIVYYNPRFHADWFAVYWQWPVQSGKAVHYQRVVLNMVRASQTSLPIAPPSPTLTTALGVQITDVLDSPTQATLDPSLANSRNFLIGFGQQVVSSAVKS